MHTELSENRVEKLTRWTDVSGRDLVVTTDSLLLGELFHSFPPQSDLLRPGLPPCLLICWDACTSHQNCTSYVMLQRNNPSILCAIYLAGSSCLKYCFPLKSKNGWTCDLWVDLPHYCKQTHLSSNFPQEWAQCTKRIPVKEAITYSDYELFKNDVIIGYQRNSKDISLFKDVILRDPYCLKHNCWWKYDNICLKNKMFF